MSKIIQRKAAEQAENIKAKELLSESDPQPSKKRKSTDAEAAPPAKLQKGKARGKKGTELGEKSSVIYLGHIPYGFFETQLRKFFMQFGIVRKLKLFRSPKTGGSRGFAFIQFESPETAQVVSEAMHGYFLHDRQLVSHVIPVAKQHEGMWKMRKPTDEMEKEAEKEEENVKEQKEDAASIKKKKEDLVKRLAEKQAKLNNLGIDFQIPALKC